MKKNGNVFRRMCLNKYFPVIWTILIYRIFHFHLIVSVCLSYNLSVSNVPCLRHAQMRHSATQYQFAVIDYHKNQFYVLFHISPIVVLRLFCSGLKMCHYPENSLINRTTFDKILIRIRYLLQKFNILSVMVFPFSNIL